MSIIIKGMREFGGVRMGQLITKPQYDQYLYALEYFNTPAEKVYRINLSDGVEAIIKEESVSQYHSEFTVSDDNILYVPVNSELRAYDGFGGTTLGSTATNSTYRTVSLAKDGTLYSMYASSNRLDIYDRNDLSTVLYSASFINGSTDVNYTYVSMDTDLDGNVYIGGVSSDDAIHKFDSTATNLWSYDTGISGQHYVKSTPDGGAVYIIINDNSNSVRKLSASGVLQWQSNALSGPLTDINVTYEGDIFVVSRNANSLAKLDQSGNVLWDNTLPTGVDPNSVRCDIDSNIYVSGYDFYIRKFDNDGNPLWSTLLPSSNVYYPIEVTAMSGSYKWG